MEGEVRGRADGIGGIVDWQMRLEDEMEEKVEGRS